MEFDLGAAELLNLGSGDVAIFIDSREPLSLNNTFQTGGTPRNTPKGDANFLKTLKILPDPQQDLGKQLIRAVRAIFPGELKYFPTSNKFVESPDNFWVVRVQPRDKSFRIVIYGMPEAHPAYATIKLGKDMKSNSAFKLEQSEQLADTIAAIKEAHRLKAL
ncbi:MAG: hypothetical protein R8M11_09120 [Gallionella sp.]